jgi:hypothetical protein
MALSKRYTTYPLELDTHTKQAGVHEYVNGVTTLMPNLQTQTYGPGGVMYHTKACLVAGDPIAECVTPDIKEIFDELSSDLGMLIDSGASGDGVNIYFAQYDDGATIKAGSVHHKTTIGDGILFPVSMNLPHRGQATMVIRILATSSDGSTSPLSFSETAALPAGVYPSVGETYTLGKFDLNGTQIQGLDSIDITFGINGVAEGGDSDLYPTKKHITTPILPSIILRSAHVDITSTLTEAGLNEATDTVVFYARKRNETGFVADGTAEHIKFTLGPCRVDTGDMVAEGIQAVITPVYTPGASPKYPITVNTASAIS